MSSIEQVLAVFGKYDTGNRGMVPYRMVANILSDLGAGEATSSCQNRFSGQANIDKFDFIQWWNKYQQSGSGGGAATAEKIFVSMLGSTEAEANIKQFASAVEKLGYDWDAQMLRDVFDRIDRSGDGQIDIDEFKQGVQLVAATQIFKEMDVDSSGEIELIEFLQAAQKISGTDYNKNEAVSVFKEVDADNSGALDLLEFLDAMNTMMNTGAGGLYALGFQQELSSKMGNLRQALAKAEARMKGLESSLGEREADKAKAEEENAKQKETARIKQEEYNRIKGEYDQSADSLQSLKGKMGPMRSQLEESMQEYGSKRAELDEAFQEQEYDKLHPLSDELLSLKMTIANLESKLGINQEEHDALMDKFTALGASHGVTAEELANLHQGVESAEARLQRAMAAHADDLEAWKATSSEYKALKKDLLQCQVKEKKAQICDTLGKLNKYLSQHRRATKRIKQLCEEFQAAEDEDDFETTGACGDKLVAAQAALDEADVKRQDLGEELKKLRAALAEEKRGLAQLGY